MSIGRIVSSCAILVVSMGIGAQAQTPRIESEAMAVEAAKRYTKARCTAETPCTFKPERDGNQWRVWVQLTRRNSPNQAPHPYPGGTLILYFDINGNLLRRLEGD
jgi:hypothetical protein